jgi:hypothetical protein
VQWLRTCGVAAAAITIALLQALTTHVALIWLLMLFAPAVVPAQGCCSSQAGWHWNILWGFYRRVLLLHRKTGTLAFLCRAHPSLAGGPAYRHAPFISCLQASFGRGMSVHRPACPRRDGSLGGCEDTRVPILVSSCAKLAGVEMENACILTDSSLMSVWEVDSCASHSSSSWHELVVRAAAWNYESAGKRVQQHCSVEALIAGMCR